MTKEVYVQALIDGIRDSSDLDILVKLIISIDRRHSLDEQLEIVNIAAKYMQQGVVAIDVCGDPRAGDWALIEIAVKEAKRLGLKGIYHFLLQL